MLYRIYTEDVNRATIEGIVSEFFDGYTVIPAVGYFQGGREKSLIIEVDANGGLDTEDRILRVASRIKTANNQKAVMIEKLVSQTRIV